MDALDEFQEQLYDHLEDFISNSDETEISFSTDLGFEQRRLVHIVASRMGLQHYSTGSGAYRYISVKKPIHFMNKRRNTGKRHRMNQNGPSLPPPSPPPRNNNNNNNNNNHNNGFVDYQSENSWQPAEPIYNNHHQPVYKMISNERYEAPDIRGRFEDDTRDRSDYVADRGGKYNNNSNNYNNNNNRSDYDETRHHGRRNYNNNNNSQEGYYNNQERKSNNNFNNNNYNNNNNNTNNYNNDTFGRQKRRRGEQEEYERENEPTRHLPYNNNNNNNTYNSYNNNNNNNTTTKPTITSEHNYYDNYFGYNNSRKQRRIIISERKIYHTHFTEEDAERNKPYINNEARPPNVRGRGYVRWGAELEDNDHHDNHHHHNHHSHHNHLIGFHDADTHYHDSNHPRNLSLFSQGHVLIEEIRTPPDH